MRCSWRSTVLLLGVVSVAISVSAQRGGGGGAGGSGGSGGTAGGHPGSGTGPSVGNTPTTGIPNSNLPNLNPPSLLFFLSGKVVVDDGSSLTEGATLQIDCKGQRRSVAHTDARGQFSFQLGGEAQLQSYEMPDATDTAGSGLAGTKSSQTTDYRQCELQALAPGFTSEQVELASRLTGDSYVDIGRVVLHRMAQVQGFMISATSAAAPPKARKNFEKGVSLEKKGKWPAAQQRFQAAVDVYPNYAEAWLELGRVQLNQERRSEAKECFQKAVAADPKFVPPYQGLIAIAVKDKNWADLADSTERILKLDPVSFPGYWFLNAAANYNQRKYDIALKNALRGVETDVQHRIPRLQYLLGLTLAQKHDYKGAVEHILNYLRAAPGAEDALVAETQLKRLEELNSGNGRE